MDRRSVAARLLRYGLLAFLYYATSAFVLNTFMQQWEFLTDHEHNGFVSMMNFTANRPWSYRVLTPAVVNACAERVPESFVRAHEAFLSRDSPVLRYMRVKSPAGWSADLGLRYHIAYFLVFGALFASCWLARALAMRTLRREGLLTDAAPLAGAIALPMTFLMGGYVYDFPELCFCLAALVCLQRRWWALWYVVYPLAVLNKEADVLLFLYFVALAWGTMPKARFGAHLAAQIVVGGAIVLAVRHAFAALPGVPAMWHLPENLQFYARPVWLVRPTQLYAWGIPFPRAFNLLNLAALALVLGWRWRAKPAAHRRLFVLTTVVLFPIFVVSGHFDEVRNLSLVFPAIYLLALDTFADVFDGAERRAAVAA